MSFIIKYVSLRLHVSSVCFFVTLFLSVDVGSAQQALSSEDKTLCKIITTPKLLGSQYFYIDVAKRKGLACADNVSVEEGSTRPSISRKTSHNIVRNELSSGFLKLNISDRKALQTRLAERDMYSANVDGLYGNGTATALRSYNKEYLGDADLTQKANVEALLDDILKVSLDDSETVVGEQVKSANPKLHVTQMAEAVSVEKAPTLADVQAAYDGKDYLAAKKMAETLAVEGNAEAQFLLGKMYADGLGSLQISKTAHMWFNIASLNGSAEAVTERNSIAETMSSEAVEEAQELALVCIQSNYSVCGVSILPKQSQQQTEPVGITTIDDVLLSSEFKTQSLLKRKQLQYALKKLGVYNSTVDGLWGSGTSTAFSNYIKINDLSASSGEAVFASVLSKVDVPSVFASPKKRAAPKKQVKTNRNTNTAGLRAIMDNPPVTGVQAKAICEPQAKMASRNAGSSSSGSTRTRCTGFGYNINCTSSDGPSSAAEGFLLGLASGLERRSAREDAMAACLAQYGWKK